MSDESATPGPGPGTTEPAPAADAPVADQARRRFFRDFAGELLQTAATVAGAASVLQRSSVAAASAILDPEGTAQAIAAAEAAAGGGVALPTGFRTAFRYGSETELLVVDQRRIPEALVEYEVRSAGHAAYAIRHLVVQGPAAAQVAAIGLALSAHGVRDASPSVLRATLKAAAGAIKVARPPLRPVAAAVDRLIALYERVSADGGDAAAVAAALRAEADRVVGEAVVDHGRIAEAASTALPDTGDRPLRVLVHGTSGPLAGGQFGTALGAIQILHHAGRPLHVWVTEGRPSFAGSRITAWELAQAGVPHAVLPDAAAASVLADGEVDAVLLAADRVALNGDVVATVGSYAIAAVAARHGVPVLVGAPLAAVDPELAEGRDGPTESRPERELVGTYVRAAPATIPIGTAARVPAIDVTPADLVTLLVTEEGALRAPYGPALTAAVERRAERWAAGPVGAAAGATTPGAEPGLEAG